MKNTTGPCARMKRSTFYLREKEGDGFSKDKMNPDQS